MISKEVKGSSGKAILVVPEDPDDLFVIRRVIKIGDILISDTTRVIKFDKEFSRPDRERVKIRVSIRVEKINLDESIDRLRISGTITESNNALVVKGNYHSVLVQIGHKIVIEKPKKWDELEINLIKSDVAGTFIMIAIDTNEAGIGKLTGTHLQMIPNIYSGQTGKYFKDSTKKDSNIEIFYDQIINTLENLTNEERFKIIIFGPGETKRKFFNFITSKKPYYKDMCTVIDGIDVAGEDGVLVFTRSPIIKEVMSLSKISLVSNILDQVMIQVNKGEEKFALGFKEVSEAIKLKSVESLVFSNTIFKNFKEEDVIQLLNYAEAIGSKVYAIDSSTDIGLRVSSLGGIVALLRYQIK
ncbi:MAG: pelota family protein [Nitrososphaeraceae archaeon]